ncbi:MAG: hypothetical protein IT244_10085, partial [Bacteroidia bacterium]|nr:hypothetical protein [Bacteroidia bacterium]
ELGWPRFYISAIAGEKHLEGFISNCYREHIYRFVDLFNQVYPDDMVYNYNKEELIALEESFNKKAAKRGKK